MRGWRKEGISLPLWNTAMFGGLRHNDDSDENRFPGILAEVSGIINYYGSVSVLFEDANPSTLNHKLPDSPEGMEMGGVNLRERPGLCEELSAECHIDADAGIAPVLIFHGTKDRIVHMCQSVNLYREMTERVHAYNSKIFLMMSGGFGRVTIPTNLGEFPPAAPSAIPHRWLDKTCRPLEKEEIHAIVESFGIGAYNAKRTGFDGIEVHAVHEGYLIDQFAISFFNQRTDEYDGSLENRLRFAKEIREEIAKTCGWDFPVALRYSPKSMLKGWREGALPGEEFEEKGRDLEEGVEAVKLLVRYGYDALDVDAGCYDAWWWNHPPMYMGKGPFREYAKLIKDNVDVPAYPVRKGVWEGFSTTL